jgi:hypothetical protein
MWMNGKAGDVILGLVGAELIEQQERVEVGQLRLPDDAAQLHACAVGGRYAGDDALNLAR